MLLRTTGLDLGTTETRKVSVGLLWGGPRPGGSNGEVRRVANIPSALLSFRRLNLPPAAREVRHRVVREELSYSLPFPLEEAVWDWTDAGEEAWVVVARKEYLATLRRLSGERTRLDAEPLSYLRAARAAGVEEALVIDLGASRTTFCALGAGRLEWVRVLLRGGRALSRRLAEARGLPLEEAEALKCREGTALPEFQAYLEELLEEALVPRPLPWGRLLLCGGGAAAPGLASFLEERLGRRGEDFPLPPPLSPYRHVAAYGAALAARPGSPRVHLREEAPAAAVRIPAVLLLLPLLILGLATLDLEVRHRSLNRAVVAQRRVLEAAVERVARDLEDLPPDQLVPALRRRVEERQRASRLAPGNFLRVLGRIAGPLQQVPKARLRALSLEEGKLTLEGQAGSLQEVERLRRNLARVLEDSEQVKVRQAGSGRAVFTFEGRLPAP